MFLLQSPLGDQGYHSHQSRPCFRPSRSHVLLLRFCEHVEQRLSAMHVCACQACTHMHVCILCMMMMIYIAGDQWEVVVGGIRDMVPCLVWSPDWQGSKEQETIEYVYEKTFEAPELSTYAVCGLCGGLRSRQAEEGEVKPGGACGIHLEKRRLLHKAPVFSAGL